MRAITVNVANIPTNPWHSIRIIAGTLHQGVQQPHRQLIGLEAPIPLAEPDCVREEVFCDNFRGGV